MANPSYVSVVERAQTGDSSAFAELVTRFQDLAVGTAYSWLGEIESARDVAQEAFLEAHRHLGQLREPSAFPGWFRQIVTKHCDRVTRRRQIRVAPLELAEGVGAIEPGPEARFAADEKRDQLRFAVDSLPAGERMIVALHYFAEATGPEVSGFLGLPVSTIKRRLRRARRRLRDEGDRLMEKTIDSMRPSKTERFAREISFFIALRAGDRTEVRRLLKLEPALVEALQDWDPNLVHEGILPFAKKATPLITAIERNDLAMQTLLLEAGADVNGLCGCVTGEAPIWAATLLNRLTHARQLLEHGADPNTMSASGNRPLHLAAMRGMREMALLLLNHGADPAAMDAGARPSAQWPPADGRDSASTSGRTAAQWATANSHDELAALIARLAGKKGNSTVHAVSRASGLQVRGPIVHTGVKALDLFAPLVRGGVIRFPFMAGVGMLVLLGELCQRFLALDSSEVIWTGFTQPPFDLSDWEAEMSEFGLKDRVQGSLVGFNESPQTRRDAFHRGLDAAESLRDSGHDVLAVILSTQGFENEVEASLLRLKAPSENGSITSIIVTPFPEKREVWSELMAPYSGQIALDRTRAQQYLFPAIHPRFSMSAGLDPAHVGERHVRLAENSLKLIDSYQKVDPDLVQLSTQDAPEERAKNVASARQLLRYLCQPFYVAEPFTGRPGEHVALNEMLDRVEEILGS